MAHRRRRRCERQQAFNPRSSITSIATCRRTRTREAIDARSLYCAARLAELLHFQSTLIVYLQQITLYVDTKDRETAGQAAIAASRSNGAVDGLADEIAKRWESMVAREQRFDAKATAIGAAQAERPRVPRRHRGAAPGHR